MLINLSNHPSAKWSEEQLAEANRLFGDIVDLPFPSVDPSADEKRISVMADAYVSRVLEFAAGQPVTVHLMGEMTLCFALVSRLQKAGIPCVASTSERLVIEFEPGRKEVAFKFIQFRNYIQL